MGKPHIQNQNSNIMQNNKKSNINWDKQNKISSLKQL